MAVNQEVKGTLARLLATENLNVEHRQVSTAYFDIENRILCLPIWKNVSANVYDMLVGHEVGHALYTPLDYGSVSNTLPQDILNVLEDVRVEKLMKRRYPGLAKSFYRGYTELEEQDFFEIHDKDLSKLSLIDRINIHFKCGVFGNRTIVPFDREELEWVNRTADTETFDDVVDLAFELVDYLKLKNVEQVEVPSNTSLQSGDVTSGGENTQEEQPVGPSNTMDDGSTQEGGDVTQDVSSVQSSEPVGGNSPDEFTSETYRSLMEKQQSLVNKTAKEYVYVNIPTVNLNTTIVSYKKNFEEFQMYADGQKHDVPEAYERSISKYREYKKESIKTVNYLTKEFECKKAADQYYRSSTSNTGVLDTQKLHTFKWNEDLFKKVTSIPDGKNHGLVFYLDWSGSMNTIMSSTLKQLYDLIWFCRKVSIPFRVYAFSDADFNKKLFPGTPSTNKINSLYIDPAFRLFEFFSSKMNAQTLDKMMEYMYYSCNQLARGTGGQYNYRYSLSGTPLVPTIITTRQVVEKFKTEEKVQKVNVVYLTDGEAAYPQYNKYLDRLNEVYAQPMHGDQIYVLRDPQTRYQCQVDYMRSSQITNNFVEYISNLVNYNLLGFRLCTKSEITEQAQNKSSDEIGTLIKQWEKTKSCAIKNCGFDELYLMQMPKEASRYMYWDPDAEVDELDKVKDSSSRSQLTSAFKKHMSGKMIHKTILSKFAGQIA